MLLSDYNSPLGTITLAATDEYLAGLWFVGQKFYLHGVSTRTFGENSILKRAKHFLDDYFSGKNPTLDFKIFFSGTPFQNEVWQTLCEIPYGSSKSYSEISKIIASKGIFKASAIAVGNAVSKNPISIIIPCHRIVGVNGALIGYAGGIWRKQALLNLERGFLIDEYTC